MSNVSDRQRKSEIFKSFSVSTIVMQVLSHFRQTSKIRMFELINNEDIVFSEDFYQEKKLE